MAVRGPQVSHSGGGVDGISYSLLRNAGCGTTFAYRNTSDWGISIFGSHWSVQQLECYWTHGGVNAALSLESTTILSSPPFLLPPFLMPLPLVPLQLYPCSLPLHFSLPVSFPNLHVTTVGHSVANRIVVLTPIICALLQMQCMARGGDQRWPRNV